MILKRKFQWVVDEEYGTEGWRPCGMAGTVNAFESRMIAHDVLEHLVEGEPCPFVDELQALGASVYVRSMAGWYGYTWPNNINPPEAHLGASICMDVVAKAGAEGIRKPPRTHSIRYPSGVECHLATAIDEAIRVFGGEGYEFKVPPSVWKHCHGWLRIGYRNAVKLYGSGRSYDAAQAFDRIGALAKRLEHEPEIVVSVSTKSFKVSAEASDNW